MAVVICLVCKKETSSVGECCGFQPTLHKDFDPDAGVPMLVQCQICGEWQGDCGHGVMCENCGDEMEDSMPTADDYLKNNP